MDETFYADMADLAAVTNIPEGTLRRWASEQHWRTAKIPGNERRRRYHTADMQAAVTKWHTRTS
jgi:hypothetical protein